MRKVFLISLVLLFSCGQKQVVYVSPSPANLESQGIDPCRVYQCSYSGKTEVEVVEVPLQDKGDFIIFPHKEAVIVKPIDAVPAGDKNGCR